LAITCSRSAVIIQTALQPSYNAILQLRRYDRASFVFFICMACLLRNGIFASAEEVMFLPLLVCLLSG